MGSTVKVLFEPYGLRTDAIPNETILDAANRSGVGIRSECGGTQICGKCRIQVRDQRGLTPATPKECKLLNEKIQSSYRLACSARFLPDADPITVIIPSESVIRKRQFVEIGSVRSVKLEPAVSKSRVEVAQPSLRERMTDSERLLISIKRIQGHTKVELDYNIIAGLPEILRQSEVVTPVLWDNKRVISVEAGDTRSTMYGLAIDVGTSKSPAAC